MDIEKNNFAEVPAQSRHVFIVNSVAFDSVMPEQSILDSMLFIY